MYDVYQPPGSPLTEDDVKRAAQSKIATLADREQQIINLVALGLSDRQIAASLIISETAVREHLAAVFEKLDVSDRLELVVYAYYHGLASLPH